MATQAVPQFSVDPWIYRMIVGVLGLVVLAVVIGGILLQWQAGKDIPQGILAIGSAAAGGLVGLLVPSPVNNPPSRLSLGQGDALCSPCRLTLTHGCTFSVYFQGGIGLRDSRIINHPG